MGLHYFYSWLLLLLQWNPELWLLLVMLSLFLTGWMFLRKPSWKYSAKLVGSQLGQLFFANIVGGIRRSYIRGPKSFAQHVLGTFALLDDHCLWLAESRALLWMKKKSKSKWMMVSLGSSLALEGICLFVDLWEVQPCLGDPEWDSS